MDLTKISSEILQLINYYKELSLNLISWEYYHKEGKGSELRRDDIAAIYLAYKQVTFILRELSKLIYEAQNRSEIDEIFKE